MHKEDFENYLSTLIENNYVVDQAMNYSLLAKSKRFRPLLLLNLLEDLGDNYNNGYPMAAAIEMVHTYSLIHDDLPAFDNDDFRRGQLTNHKKFGEETAILAGDGLLTLAFETIASSNYNCEIKVNLISQLAQAAGHNGMIRGQSFDKQYENKIVSKDELIKMYADKTGCLITAPLISALIIKDIKNEHIYEKFKKLGFLLGVAFQIQDDLLEVSSIKQDIGKSTSDVKNNKQTYHSKTSIVQAQQYVDEIFFEIHQLLEGKYPKLEEYIDSFKKRNW